MADYCSDSVRASNPDLYLATLFAPEEARPHLFGLYAFAHEVAAIPDRVHEPHLGEIRQQWWLDTLDALYAGETVDHPVAIALQAAISRGDLPKHSLRNLILARQRDLYTDPVADLVQLEGYLGETCSAVIQMASLILAGPDALESAEAAGYAGVGQGLTRLLATLPATRRRGQCYLPADMLSRRQATPTDFVAGQKEVSLGLVLAELRTHARERLASARRLHWTIPKKALPAFLPVCTADVFLGKLDRFGVKAVWRAPEPSRLRLQWHIWRTARAEAF
jgi:phytoene synthase